MANARAGYKRIMGEIPVEMHEKITHYNKISERPLNVSRAIELCMQQAVKKIDTEILAEAAASEPPLIRAEGYHQTVIEDINAGLSPAEIHKRFIELLRKEGWKMVHSGAMLPLYPIDGVKIDKSGVVLFYAGNILCFVLGTLNHRQFKLSYEE